MHQSHKERWDRKIFHGAMKTMGSSSKTQETAKYFWMVAPVHGWIVQNQLLLVLDVKFKHLKSNTILNKASCLFCNLLLRGVNGSSFSLSLLPALFVHLCSLQVLSDRFHSIIYLRPKAKRILIYSLRFVFLDP